MSDSVWVVWGSNGEYSGRTQWPAAWCDTEAEAMALCARMNAASRAWDKRMYGLGYSAMMELRPQAHEEIGDSCWCDGGTVYDVVEVPRGKS